MTEKRITVHKLDEGGNETWKYEGEIVRETSNSLTLHAHFDRDEVDFFGVKLEREDLFVETFFSDRWYNVFSIFSPGGEHHKGWYCNVTRPAKFEDGHIYAEDLALDLLVFPDGKQKVLDEDEFELLDLEEGDRSAALRALAELRKLAEVGEWPFRT